MNFDQAFEILIDVEKGLSMDPKDNGNWTGAKVGVGVLKGTKYGISAGAYPNEDIVNLTLGKAKLLYLHDYWNLAGCTAVPEAIRFDLFDTAVNSGVGRAARLLQRTVGTVEDGQIGPKTLQAIASMPVSRLVAHFNAHRLIFMTDAPTWLTHGKGWARRIADNLVRSV